MATANNTADSSGLPDGMSDKLTFTEEEHWQREGRQYLMEVLTDEEWAKVLDMRQHFTDEQLDSLRFRPEPRANCLVRFLTKYKPY